MSGAEMGEWGAKIERGRITGAKRNENGMTKYTVESIDRPGVASGNISWDGETIPAETLVYFFLFGDGAGRVIGKITR